MRLFPSPKNLIMPGPGVLHLKKPKMQKVTIQKIATEQ